ncbi:MAG: hypothetical protein ACR2M1_10520 [Gemmatimonadaceae bacterium]
MSVGNVLAKASLTWSVPPSVMAQHLETSLLEMEAVVHEGLAQAAAVMKDYEVGNHPWVNRTGAAEAQFTVEVQGYRILARHGVFYGIYLEYKNGGRWGVLPGVMTAGEAAVGDVLNRALERLLS